MTLSIIPVSEAERGAGALTQETTLAALTGLHEQGATILRGVFPPAFIDQLHDEFRVRYGAQGQSGLMAQAQAPFPNPLQKVGDARFEVALRMNGPFGQPYLFANPVIVNFLKPFLGHDLMRLGSMTAVASFPGAQMQHIHRDHSHLFHEFPQIGPALPLYAVNVTIPLLDIDNTMGPTAIWPGSHRWPEKQEAIPGQGMVSIPFQRGDAILIDYRTMHTGMPNNSQTMRPILYLVYTREWFFDDNNHRGRAPMNISLQELQLLPAELGTLMMRAGQQQIRALQFSSR